jgi:hypothetical protein
MDGSKRLPTGRQNFMSSNTDHTRKADLFAKLADPATTGKFFERVSDSVSWTVEGTHPLAGSYTSKQAFFDSTFLLRFPELSRSLQAAAAFTRPSSSTAPMIFWGTPSLCITSIVI